MKLFNKNKPSIVIPSGWHQITIGQYEEIINSLKQTEVDENYLRAWSNAIAAATNKQPEEILAQKTYIIHNQIKRLDWLTETHGEKFVNEVIIYKSNLKF